MDEMQGKEVLLHALEYELLGEQEWKDTMELSHCQLPVTLYVNHESRTETLKHYYVLFRGDVPGIPNHRWVKKPFCFNPTRDMAVLLNPDNDFTPELRSTRGIDCAKWLSYIQFQHPSCLSKVQKLEIRNLIWKRGVLEYFDRNTKKAGKEKRGCEWFDAILSFPTLEELCTTRHRLDDWRSAGVRRVPKSKAQIRNVVAPCLEAHKEYFVNGKVPKLTIRYWQPLGTR